MKSCGRSSGASSEPSPVPSCGPAARKNGTSAPISRRDRREPLERERRGERVVREQERSRGVGAAAAEPCRDRDLASSIRTRQLGLDARRAREPRRAPPRRSCRPAKPSTVEPRRRLESSIVSARSMRCRTVSDLVLAVRAERADDEREVDLRRCAERAAHASLRVSSTNSGGSSASARTDGSRPERGERRDRRSRVATRRRAASEFASVLRRCANAPSTTRPHSGEVVGQRRSAGTRRAPSRRSGGGRKTVARDRMESGSHGRELDQHGDRAVRLRRRAPRRSGRRPHAAPSRTTDRSRAAGRGSRPRSAWRRCTAGWRRAWSAAGSRPRGRAAARPPSAARRSGPRRVSRQVRLEAAVELDGVDVARTRSARTRVRTPRPGPISSTTSSGVELGEPGDDAEDVVVDEEVLAERLPGRRGAHGGGQAECHARVARRSAPRASRRTTPRASARTASVWSTLAGSFRLPRSGCGARYGLSVSARIRSAGTAAAASRSAAAFGIGHVAGERDVVAALERAGRAAPGPRSSGG